MADSKLLSVAVCISAAPQSVWVGPLGHIGASDFSQFQEIICHLTTTLRRRSAARSLFHEAHFRRNKRRALSCSLLSTCFAAAIKQAASPFSRLWVNWHISTVLILSEYLCFPNGLGSFSMFTIAINSTSLSLHIFRFMRHLA